MSEVSRDRLNKEIVDFMFRNFPLSLCFTVEKVLEVFCKSGEPFLWLVKNNKYGKFIYYYNGLKKKWFFVAGVDGIRRTPCTVEWESKVIITQDHCQIIYHPVLKVEFIADWISTSHLDEIGDTEALVCKLLGCEPVVVDYPEPVVYIRDLSKWTTKNFAEQRAEARMKILDTGNRFDIFVGE